MTPEEIARIASFRETCRHAHAAGCSVTIPADLADVLARGLDEVFAVMEAQNNEPTFEDGSAP